MQRVWVVLDVSLAMLAVLLLFPLFNITLPHLGQAVSPGTPACAVQWATTITPWPDLEQCCLAARQQLTCVPAAAQAAGQRYAYRCATGEGEVVSYWLNEAAFAYCQQQVIW